MRQRRARRAPKSRAAGRRRQTRHHLQHHEAGPSSCRYRPPGGM